MQFLCIFFCSVYCISPYVCLTDCPGLKSSQVVRHLRFQAHLLLEEVTCEQRGRFGELLLVLPPLQSVAWQMVETLHLAQLLGEARMDSLLLEMLLGEGAKEGHGQTQDQRNEHRASPTDFISVTSHISTCEASYTNLSRQEVLNIQVETYRK